MTLFRLDPPGSAMAALITFVLIVVLGFSKRYMAGDRTYTRYRVTVLLLGISAWAMVLADNVWILLTGWGLSNLLLVRLMVHKAQWQAARNAGFLALRTLGTGFILLGLALYLLYGEARSSSLSTILAHSEALGGYQTHLALLLIAVAAMTQSALWPFHRWLLSSLNSPTPVSALMHAGLVNGGGFLLVRFAPLYLVCPELLSALFAAGLLTAVLGSSWKLLQTDIKRMLACSTLGQMGFMVMQCGMGLFAAAISHLCWHGLFKAYLFLSAGSVVQEKRQKLSQDKVTLTTLGLSCLFGLAGAYTFALSSGHGIHPEDTRLFLVGMAFLAATQLACSVLENTSLPNRVPLSLIVSSISGLLYGLTLRWVEHLLAPLNVMRPQPLNAFYIAGFLTMAALWLVMNLNLPTRLRNTTLYKRLYLAGLNGAQPHASTITAKRSAYHV